MPVTVDATVGGASSNSYVTTSDGDAYFADRLNASAWTAASADQKAQAVITATGRLDQEDWEGSPVRPLTGTSSDLTQALKWPRNAADNDEDWTYLNTVVPEPVKRATLKLALVYLGASDDPLADTGLEGFEEVAVGPVKVKPRHSRIAGALPEDVLREIEDLLVTSGRVQFSVARA